jgi:hypothetical protein
MKIGDIVCNKMAGENNPARLSMYIGRDSKFIKTIYSGRSGEMKIMRLYKNSLDFEIVGHSKGFDMMRKELRDLSKESWKLFLQEAMKNES